MKIVIKEIDPNGNEFLVYEMTETNQPISCDLVKNDKLENFLTSLSDKLPRERYTYNEYLKQNQYDN